MVILTNYRFSGFNLSKKINKLLCSLLIISISFCFSFPAYATTQTIKLTSIHGYEVETTFSYDDDRKVTILKEAGLGKTKVIESMKVDFYQPSGELISSYDNIINGVTQAKYFEFSFDPLSQKILGNIDLGGEVKGEIYLKGLVDQELSLVEIDALGVEKVIDHIIQ